MPAPLGVGNLGCIFRRNYVYSGTFLSYSAEMRVPMPPENGKVIKTVSLPELQLVYIRISYVGLPQSFLSY